jgi:hypothetical protein
MGAHPLFIWALALFVHFAAARSADPIVKVNRFHNMPARLFLFDDAAVRTRRVWAHICSYAGPDTCVLRPGSRDGVYQRRRGQQLGTCARPSWRPDQHSHPAPVQQPHRTPPIVSPPRALTFCQAFALTDGREHFQTDDCGNTWRRFRVPAPPAWVASPLAFHSDRAREGYILYQGRVCDYGIGGWGAVCYDEVRGSRCGPRTSADPGCRRTT